MQRKLHGGTGQAGTHQAERFRSGYGQTQPAENRLVPVFTTTRLTLSDPVSMTEATSPLDGISPEIDT